MVPDENAIERPRGRHEPGAVLGEDDPLDQGVHCRVLDADIILRADLIGGGRAPEPALLVAR